MIELSPVCLRLPLDAPVVLSPGHPPTSSLDLYLVRASTAEATAYGEAALAEPAHFAAAVEYFADSLRAADPCEAGLLWQRMAWRLRTEAPEPMADYAAVLGAVDMALWDLAGRALNQPCHRLLGGARAKVVDCYARGVQGDDPETTAWQAADLRRHYGALQLQLSGELAADRLTLRTARKMVGDEQPLMGHGGGAFTDRDEAAAYTEMIEPYELVWYHELFAAPNWDGYRQLRPQSGTPLAAGETLAGLGTLAQGLTGEAVDALSADLRRCGGISTGRQLADLAALYQSHLTFTVGASPLGLLAALQVTVSSLAAGARGLAVVPASLWEIITPAPVFKNGFLQVPAGPGLGGQLREQIVDAYQIEVPLDE